MSYSIIETLRRFFAPLPPHPSQLDLRVEFGVLVMSDNELAKLDAAVVRARGAGA